MSTAVFNILIDKGPIGLNGFNDTPTVRIELPSGKWAIFGKVVITNFDGGAQNASAVLLANDGALVLDRTDVRIASSEFFAQSLSVQGTLVVPPIGNAPYSFVHISCSTYNGEAKEAQLIAISIDEFAPSDL